MNKFYLKNKEKSNAFHAASKRALLLMVLVAAAFLPEETKAAVAGSEVSNDVVTYDLKLGDVAVTSENCNDIQFEQHWGKASYDAETKTLTLDSLLAMKKVLYSGIDGLKIKIKHDVTIQGGGSYIVLQLNANTVIDGSEAECLNMSTLSVGENTEVVFRNFNDFTASSIRGVSGEAGEKLVFDNCNADIITTLTNIASVTFENCGLPDGWSFDESRHGVVYGDGDFAEYFRIKVNKEYDLWVCGERVTTKNYSDLSKVPGVKEGYISFDGDNNVLYMAGCKIETPDGVPAIRSNMENLCVRASYSNNDIIAKGAPALKFEKGGSCIRTLAGGSLSLSTSDDQPAILATDSLYIYQADLTASGKYGVAGSGNGVYLDVNSGKVKLYGKESATSNLSGCSITNTLIKTPEGAEYDSKLRGFAVGGKLVSDTLFLYMAKYNVYIGDCQLDETNCGDISLLPGVDGKGYYDSATGTLILDNAKLSCNIYFEEGNADILVKGKCEINYVNWGDNYYGILYYNVEKATIRGVDGGELKINIPEDDYSHYYSQGIRVYSDGNDADISIDNCDMEINCSFPVYSTRVYTYEGNAILPKLKISNSNVKMITENYPVRNIRVLELSGCKVTSPQNAIYQEGYGYYLEGEETYYNGNLVIERDNAVGIENIKPEVPAARQSVYTIDGVKLSTSVENLPAGLYIINGKKVLKK